MTLTDREKMSALIMSVLSNAINIEFFEKLISGEISIEKAQQFENGLYQKLNQMRLALCPTVKESEMFEMISEINNMGKKAEDAFKFNLDKTLDDPEKFT